MLDGNITYIGALHKRKAAELSRHILVEVFTKLRVAIHQILSRALFFSDRRTTVMLLSFSFSTTIPTCLPTYTYSARVTCQLKAFYATRLQKNEYADLNFVNIHNGNPERCRQAGRQANRQARHITELNLVLTVADRTNEQL